METDVKREVERADRARKRLSQDLGKLSRTAEAMSARAKTTLKYAIPIAIGVAVVGLIAGALMRSRSRPPYVRMPRVEQRPSWLAEALRTASLSAVSVLASRIAQQVPLPLMDTDDHPAARKSARPAR